MISRLIGSLAALALLASGQARAQPAEPVPPAAAVLTRADAQAWLDGLMPTALQLSRVPGAVIVIVKDGQTLIEQGYGVANWERQTPVDPASTLFRPGSISKLFTWTAVMQLVEQGKLDLDVDVNRYLDFTIPARDGKALTLRDVMTHTTGFEETYRDLVTFDGPSPDIGAWLKQNLPPRQFAPGTTPGYSNYGATLAGYIVQRVSGQPFADYIDQHIFLPLGMLHSTFRQPLPPPWQPNMATGYRSRDDKGEGFETIQVAPAGALTSTGDDMSRFLLAYLQGGRLGDARILKAETVTQMFTTGHRALPDLNAIALGFYHQDLNGHRVLSHDGDTLYFHSMLRLFVDDHIGIFLSVNAAGKDDLGGHMRESVFQGFADRYLPGSASASAPARATPAVAREHARLIAGKYASTRGGESNFLSMLAAFVPMVVVANDDGTIQLDLDGTRHVYAETAQPFLWQEVGGKDRLQALVKDGKVARWSLDAVAPAFVYEPISGLAASEMTLPLLLAALAVVLVTALQWPAAAFARRYYHAALTPSRAGARSLRAVRLAAISTLVALGIWTGVLMSVFTRFTVSPGAIFAAQVLTLLALVGGLASSLWRASVVVRPTHGAWSRIASLAWVAAFALMLATATAYHWIGFSPNY